MGHVIIVTAKNAQGVEIIRWQVMKKKGKFTLERKIEGAFPQDITFTIYKYGTEEGTQNKAFRIGQKTLTIPSPSQTITIKSDKKGVIPFKIK